QLESKPTPPQPEPVPEKPVNQPLTALAGSDPDPQPGLFWDPPEFTSQPPPCAEPTPAPSPSLERVTSQAEENCGTCVKFLNSPTEAASRAVREQKLLFTLHVSGNFEDRQFT